MDVIKFDLDDLRNNNDGFSYYIIGRSYDLEENGVSQDYKLAIDNYYKGMSLGDPMCEYSVGISYVLGLGDVLPKDLKKGDMLLRDAYPRIAEIVDDYECSSEKRVYAKFIIGAYNYFGLGDVAQNYDKAFSIIKECADAGHVAAIYDLGANFYYNGVGCDKNREKAKHYLGIAKDAMLPRAIKKYDEYGFNSSNIK